MQSSGEISSFRGEHSFLSNFFVHPFVYDGVTWMTSEHTYQAAKTCLNDPVGREIIRQAETPGKAKCLGRTIKIRPDWEEVKVPVMRAILKAKFSNPVLAAKLIATGDLELVEGNSWGDREWGCVRDEDGDWAGKNLLGKLLMEIRSQLI